MDFTDAVRALLALRRNWPLFRLDRYIHKLPDGKNPESIAWCHPDGTALANDDWAHARALMMVLKSGGQAAALLFNGAENPFEFHPPGQHWAIAFASPADWPVMQHDRLLMPGKSSACLVMN